MKCFGVRAVLASLLRAHDWTRWIRDLVKKRTQITAALSPIASELRFFRDERRSDGSEEVVAGIFAGSDGGAESDYSYRRGMQARVASPRRFDEANRLPVSEARHSAIANLECDSWLLVVGLRSPCSSLPRLLVRVAPLPAAFDMPCNLRPVPQSMRSLFAGHNESVLGFLSGVQRRKPL